MSEGANSGVDLHLDLRGRGRLRESLEAALREAMSDGRLASGAALPPSRALAADLGIARNTVTEAYAQLVAEGWLVARTGAGTRVAHRPEVATRPAAPAGQQPDHPRYDLRAGFPDLASFPRTEWLAASRAALTAAPSRYFGYGWPEGMPELRTSLAGYLGRARGVRTSVNRIVVTPGFTSALHGLAHVLHAGGARRIGVESYGHANHRNVFHGSGLELVPIGVDDDGALPDALDRVDAVLLTPAHQFPIGSALSAQRRARFAAWAARTGGVIIEDDYDGEFRYDRRALGALQALAADHVVYAGTASKTLSPGVRLGWLALPDRFVEPFVAWQSTARVSAATIEQLTLAHYLDTGRYDRHVRRMRLQYRRRRDRLLAGLSRRVPSLRVTGTSAGMHTMIDLPRSIAQDEVIGAAHERGLALECLRTFAIAEQPDRCGVVVGYGTPPPHLYSAAVARLLTVLSLFQR